MLSLLGTARRFSLPMVTVEISGEPPTPQGAKALKPVFLKQWLKYGPVVWLDADARIHKYPKLLFGAIEDYDIALFSPRDGEYYSGTVFFNTTEKSRKVLDLWEEALKRDDWELDQQVLSDIIKGVEPKIFKLPFSYCWSSEMAGPSTELPVIEHYRIGFKKQVSEYTV